ncbi:PPP4R2-domain-containing protein [Gautieria morchelliformis]|nr:PPP4R2-domain-containing protein [Gautieria morchelliformis]
MVKYKVNNVSPDCLILTVLRPQASWIGIQQNVRRYLSGDWDAPTETNFKKTPEPMPHSSPMSLPPSSPPTFPPSPVHQGLVIPPFPKRERRKDGPVRIFNSDMDEQEAGDFQSKIFEQLEDFDSDPPFTIQRLCELCVEPRIHYKAIGKYLRAVERTILVTSTRDMYPSEVDTGDVEMGASFGDNESLRLAMTPVFSPIPFLHDDARRSRSPSPFELAATRRPSGSHDDLERPAIDLSTTHQGIGLVDELDDPMPGHLANHPTPLTTVASAGPPTPLNERFVKSTSPGPESEQVVRDAHETVDARQAEDAEVEGMVLDDNVLEDEDKENRPS